MRNRGNRIRPSCGRHQQNAVAVCDDLIARRNADTADGNGFSHNSGARFDWRQRRERHAKYRKSNSLNRHRIPYCAVDNDAGNPSAQTLQRHKLTKRSHFLVSASLADNHRAGLRLNDSSVQSKIVAGSTSARKRRAGGIAWKERGWTA
jgi:hypothetical protein